MTIDLTQFHATFLEESLEGLDVMESSLLDLNLNDEDPETINTIFRAAHSIKGGSGTFGFMEIAEFTHVQETLLDQIRSSTREATQDIINTLLESVDCVREMLFAEKDKRKYDADHVNSVRAKLDSILNANENPVATVALEEEINTASVQGWNIKFAPHPGMIKTGNDPVRILRELSSLGLMEVQVNINKLPELAQIEAECCYLSWDIELFGDIEEAYIREIFDWVVDDCDLSIIPMSQADGLQQQNGNSIERHSNSQALKETLTATEISTDTGSDELVAEALPEVTSARKRSKTHGRQQLDQSEYRKGR